jgi:gliding motility-associated-like protein
MRIKAFLLTAIAVMLLQPILFSQTLYNNGVVIKVTNGATLYVDGVVQNQTGTIDIDNVSGTSVLITEDDFINNATAGGSGYYRIYGDWVNNSVFNAGTGTVFLEGGAQLLSGSVSTTFYNLTLNGSGQKTQTINQYCGGILNLNALELRTQTFGFFVTNTSSAAITLTTGFVSSLNGGFLSRATNTTNTYLFPVGSTVGTTRYRPVEMTPTSANASTFTVRMANVDATTETFDRSLLQTGICEVNPLFYHQINRTAGTAASDISIFYDNTADGSWQGISNWGTAPNQWNIVAGSSTTTGAPLYEASVAGWNTFSNIPYALYVNVPDVIIGGNTPVCEGDDLNLTESGGDAASWSWTGPDGFTSTDQNPVISPVTIDANGLYTVVIDDGHGCTNTASITIKVDPDVDATITPDGPFCETEAAVTLVAVTSGGTWSGTAVSGDTFDPAAAGPGDHIISYSVTQGACSDSDTETFHVDADVDATITADGPFCSNESAVALVAASAGGVWSGTGVVGSNFNPATANIGNNTINYIVTNGACTDSDSEIFVVDAAVDATITPAGPFCETLASVTLNAASPGGTWSGTGIVNPATGQFAPSLTGCGNFVISYSITNGVCSDNDTENIQVDCMVDATITPIGPFCDYNGAVALTAITPGGTWSGTGVSGTNFFPALAGPGAHPINYSIVNGTCSDSDNITVTVNAAPAAPISSTDCTGGVDQGIITVTSPVGANYEYSVGGPFQAGTSFGPLVNGTYTVTVNNTTSGCTSSGALINLDCGCLNPTALTLSALNGTTCEYENETVSGNTFGGSATQVSLSHNGAGSLDQTTISASPFSFTYTPAAADAGNTVTITVTTDNPEGLPCTAASQNYTLTVRARPDVTAGSDSPACEGDPINFTETGGDASGWTWSGPNGFSSLQQNPQIASATLAADGTYNLTVSNIYGCTNSGTTDVTINASPTIAISSDAPVCENSPLSFFENGGDATGWSWTGPAGFTSTDQNPQIASASPSNDGTYNLTITDVNTCTATDNITISVHPAPTVNVSSNSPICEGGDLNLTENGGDATGWSWTGPDGFVSTDQNPNLLSIGETNEGNYTVIITDVNSCTSTANTFVIVNPLPIVTTTSNSPVCEGGNINLGENGGDATSWSWTGPDGFVSDQQNPVISGAMLINAGLYTVLGEDALGCQTSANVNIVVNTNPDAPVISTDCSGGEDNGLITVTSPLGAEYEYSITGTYQAGIGFGPLTNGTYTVTVQDINTGCTTAGAPVTLTCGCADQPTLSLANLSDDICGTQVYTLSGNTFGGSATQVSLSHNGAGNLDQTTISASPFTFSYTPDATDIGNTVNIIVTTNNPLGLPCNEATQTLAITILEIPTISASSNSPVCAGEDIELTGTGTDIATWAWTGPDSYSSGDQNPIITNSNLDNDGIYTLNVIANNSCIAQTSVDVTVNDNPPAPITSVDCSGGVDEGIITISSPIGAQYEYNIGTGAQSSNIFGSLANGSYTVTVTNTTTGCSSSGSVINVDCGCDNPPTVTLADNADNTCGTDAITVTGNAFGGSATEVNASHDGTGNLSEINYSVTPFSFTYTPASGDIGNTVTINFVTDNPSGSPCSAASSVFVLTVLELPEVIASNSSPVCVNSDISFNETGGDAISWAWSGPNSFSSTDQNPAISSASLLANGTYTVVVTGANGCINSSSTDVLIVPNADADITEPGYFCDDNISVDLEAVPAGGIWSGESIDPISGEFNPSIAGEGEFEIIYTIPGQCGDADTITITIYPRADASIYPVDTLFFSDPTIFVNTVEIGGYWSGVGINASTGEFLAETAGVGEHEIFYTIDELCGANDSIIIVVIPDIIPDLLIPDVLTPNGDGYNDRWRVQGIQAFDNIEIVIFDRWGDEVFIFTGSGTEYHDPSNQWDGIYNGKELPFGTYVYLLVLNQTESFKGTVTIIR